MGFVNPYNFAPFPAEVRRNRAWGHVGPATTREGDWFHEEGRALYSGRIEVQWELKTPLQLPPGDALHEWWDPGTSTVRIPGSSIKGAVRSLHEAMFNGCLCIFDENFVPGYRMPATAWPRDERAEWSLALVASAKAGRPTSLRLTRDVCFVSATALAAGVHGALPRSGDVVQLNVEDGLEHPHHGRKELDTPTIGSVVRRASVEAMLAAGEAPDGCIFLITDMKARQQHHPFYWAAARLTGDVHEIGERDTPALERFDRSVAGTEDRRWARNTRRDDWQRQPQFVNVSKDREPALGSRARQTGYLFPGDVVWVRMTAAPDGLRLEDLRLAQIWREVGSGPSGQRVLPDLHACRPTSKAQGLCLSCATFGSIDATKKSESDGEAVGYRGHVGFSSAVAGGVQPQVVTRAPLSSPNPGAGVFNLLGLRPDVERTAGDIASHWGSEADGEEGFLRGRKFYWHANPQEQADHWTQHGAYHSRPRYVAAMEQPLRVAGVRLVMPSPARNAQPTVLTGSVTFDRIPMPALQALLAALDPQRAGDVIQPGRSLAIHLGGGKPLGLGAAAPRITGLTAISTAGRYLGAEGETVGEFQQADLLTIIRAVGNPPLHRVLKLLDIHGLSYEERVRVTYPPARPWTQFGTKEFAKSYVFFTENSGLKLENGADPFTPLPRAGDPQIIEWDPR